MNIAFEDLLDEDYPAIIIKPNLGYPQLVNIQEYTRKELDNPHLPSLHILLLANDNITKNDIKSLLENNVFIQPLLKSEGEFYERRGQIYPLKIQSVVEEGDITQFESNNSPPQKDCELFDIYKIIKKKGFKKRKKIFQAKLSIDDLHQLSEILNQTNFSCLLCDLILHYPELNQKRVNFHAIALFKKQWKDFRFIHAADTHIARRNDFIGQFLKKKARKRREMGGDKWNKPDSYILDRKLKFKEEFQEQHLKRFRHGKFNFNANLRRFITFANDQIRTGELDFIVITGDLIDYVKPANYDDYYEDNFQFLFDIFLGINRDLELEDEDFKNQEELMCPLFTVVGNHDYRIDFYSLKTGTIYRKFGLKRRDIRKYKDEKPFLYLRALYSRTKFLHSYLLLFNPNLNYKVNVGDSYSLIMLDTGMDSIANLFDLMRSAPSTRGLKKFQIKILQQFIKQSDDRHIIMFMHAPPLSPNFSRLKKWQLRRKFGLKRPIEWADLYEQNITKYQDYKRLEPLLDFNYQTITYRWEKLLKILVGTDEEVSKKTDLVLCGHTHTLKEFRIKKAEKKEQKRFLLWLYFIPIHTKSPCKIYTSRYRDMIEHFANPNELKQWFEQNKPFIFHTQGLGPLSSKFKVKSPGFRLISVIDNQISNIDVYSLQILNHETYTLLEKEKTPLISQ
ncbi:MAG: hypothetical protein BAJALOKI1v1_270006 [Promethearchaeota archaeon]|nr:MAG: hypothetical protein BAJALOKI1v1_270006 [Candidatus Lokiarchaeota archaeon]